ncbi:MAG: uroporphyrinogen decarboxylase family protein [Acetobacteraceae bacterium]|jgi:uroporphyrinogen decarboxylase
MPASQMTHWERVTAAVAGQAVDRVPVSLWHHFPEIDLDPVRLAEACVHWQQTHDFDLVKFMPAGTYSVEDWGATSAYLGVPNGTRTVITHGVTNAEQWPRLARLSPHQGRLGQELKALSLAAVALKDDVPLLQTVFSPLTTALKLAGDRVFADLRRHADLFEAGLAIIAEATLGFARACLRAGAHGLFFATQCASYRMLSEAEHRRFGLAYDRLVLDGVRDEAAFTLLHLHGNDVMFDQVPEYKANMVNWHDRRSELDLAGAMSRFDGLLVGGVNEATTLPQGSVEAIRNEVRNAIAQTGGRRLMIAPGCVVPIATPEAHYRAVIDAVNEMPG